MSTSRKSWLVSTVAGATALVGSVFAGAAQAAPAVPADGGTAYVNLRIEGPDRTIFEGVVATSGHAVTTAAGGTHQCDGTNNNANPTPGPTPTAALDDAAKKNNFTWDGPYYQEFDDFLVSRIADASQTTTKFWNLAVDYKLPDVGGCQYKLKAGERVLWAYDGYDKPLLELDGPTSGTVGKPVTLKVIDGRNGQPVAGATVGGATTDANGNATITPSQAGRACFKAEKTGTIRSDRHCVTVS
ncbi:DUF4430 domain-containing protein [Streptoalloteichus tenebrarius]|uniref:DUF4430 domain-containing protein n=1 Tax=Streptoalloteichus tenebrarius (strain ATCC 17920 / DSM 40477 / JCM 4838 / CBS 697.72 / NBRC 16177 / NCIMB 11028 / NRRL B-12390 / A12253. 1 / ISP 5477) TaxID=1933 RepID=UPI0020A4A736|nr:DUF4430 domain-containing protein [Streptoalloteichus tenebrarius]